MVSAYAPGRVELLGNHTDYHEGLVLGAAINLGLTIRGDLRSDGRIILSSPGRGVVEVSTPDFEPLQSPEQRWANYALGVAAGLHRRGVNIGGFSAEIVSDLPEGHGLSSSAAFAVATAFFLLKLFHGSLPLIDIAKISQEAEHEFVGVRSGLLDQVMSIFGKAGHTIFFDVRAEEIRAVPFPAAVALVIGESGVKRQLADGRYNSRREETFAAARALGVRTLRDATVEQLSTSDLDDVIRRRALHVVCENERVGRAVEFLERGRVQSVGALMYESHESSRTNFENSTPELDTLVDLARKIPGVFGSRLTGAGFGGATVTLCDADCADEAGRRLRERAARVFITRPADGAR